MLLFYANAMAMVRKVFTMLREYRVCNAPKQMCRGGGGLASVASMPLALAAASLLCERAV